MPEGPANSEPTDAAPVNAKAGSRIVETNNALQYALVAYIRGPIGQFVDQLRKDLYEEHAHLAAHITVLPPRGLRGSETNAVEYLRELAERFSAFEIEIGDPESFAPTTPTVFLRITRSAHRFRDMHLAFNSGPFQREEQWTYIPHFTVVKMPDLASAGNALRVSRERWANYSGSRIARIKELTFVRETGDGNWLDLATLNLDKAVHA